MNELEEEKLTDSNIYDVAVIGGSQEGLSLGYYLRRSGLRYVILDGSENGGRRVAERMGFIKTLFARAVEFPVRLALSRQSRKIPDAR